MIVHEHIIQGSETWDDARATRPTGSEYAKIYTGSGKLSMQREKYMRQLSINTNPDYRVPGFKGNKWTDRGHELEPVARELFIEKTGFNVREIGFVEHDKANTGISPDGLIYASEDDPVEEPVGGLEIKCFNEDKHLAIVHKNEIPVGMKPQVHGALWVTGVKAWAVVFYCPEAFPLDFHMIEVTPNDYTIALGAEIIDFCKDHERNWQQYLSEYEVDLLNASVPNRLPVLSNLISPVKEMKS